MTVIKIKNSNVTGRLPSSGDIEIAELALNIADKKLYSKDAAGAIFEIGVAGDIPSGVTPPSAGNNNGDLYFDTATGRLLYWDGSGWQTVVKASGDNFTGNVTLGTDKITLDATVGSWNSKGWATFRNGSVNNAQVLVLGSAGAALQVEDDSGTNTVQIQQDGSATFAGRVDTANGFKSTGDYGFNSFSDKTGPVITINNAAGNSPKCIINNDGSAIFAGNISVTDDSIASSTVNSDGSIVLRKQSGDVFKIQDVSANDKITLNATGSAEFAGPINSTVEPTTGVAVLASADGNLGLTQDYAYISRGQFSANRTVNGATFISNLNGAQNIILNSGGTATFSGTVTATVVPPGSDARFKKNITPAKPQLADVVALGGLLKNYDWNEDAPVNDEIRAVRQLGLVAQEVEEVCPKLVMDVHRTKTVEVTPAVLGPKGRVITEAVTEEVDNNHKTLRTDALVMKLIGAVAELSAEVTALKAEKLTKK